jgi:hypothetical protein
VGPLLNQIEQEIGQITADGANDRKPSYDTIAKQDPRIHVAIPPRVTAQPSVNFETESTLRDTHLFIIQSLGRLAWQETCGYSTRALVKTTMGRYKAIIGPQLHALNWQSQWASP